MGLRVATEAETKHAASSRQGSCFKEGAVESTFELNCLFAGTSSTATFTVVLIKSNLSEAVTATNDLRFASKHCLHGTVIAANVVTFV